jgi:hypothetical protein
MNILKIESSAREKACPEAVEQVGSMTKRLSDPYALSTATKAIKVVEL